jgi:hypothetical protein
MKLDFFATQKHYLDHLKSIWETFPARNRFWVSQEIAEYAEKVLGEVFIGQPKGIRPVLVSCYGDMVSIIRDSPEAKVILMEHGIGMTYGTAAYADGYGRRAAVSMFLLQSQYVAKKMDSRLTAPRSVIGIPKLDPWVGEFNRPHPMPQQPVLGLSFHHSNYSNVPEAQNAWEIYVKILPKLAKKYHVIGHGHPLELNNFRPVYEKNGIEFVDNFEEVMRRADILLFDCTSAGFEYLVTGKPVIILNSPKFRRDKQWGIRFWDYSNIGPMVEGPEELLKTIEMVILDPDRYKEQRKNAIKNLIPYIGTSTQKATKVLMGFLAIIPDPEPKINILDCNDSGIIYICFGEKAKMQVLQSIVSMRELGMNYPICVVGDRYIDGTYLIEWDGENPYDKSRPKGLRFLAGRIKPSLYKLSPFKKTLYIDADTRFRQNILPGFEFLKIYDMAMAEERQTLRDLHNPERHSDFLWYHDPVEVEESIKELGDPSMVFMNSGVIFFRKSRRCEKLFEDWKTEWLRYQQWDEQMALLRAAKRNSNIKIKNLPVSWNCPYDKTDIFIYHQYARCSARENV